MRPAASRFVVRPEHVRHQAGIEPDPPHRRTVTAVAGTDADPAFGPGHPSEGHGARGARDRRQPGGRRLDEHHMLRRDPDVVLPGGPLQLHRLGGAQRPSGVPLADAQEDALAVTRRRPPPSLVSSRRRPRTAPARRRRPAGARARRSGRSARRRTPRAPGTVSTARESRPRGERGPSPACQKHTGIGVGLLALIPDGLAVPELHGVQGTGLLATVRRRLRHRHRPPRADRHRRRQPTAASAPGSAIRSGRPTLGPGPPRPRRPHPEQGPLQIRRQRARHGQGECTRWPRSSDAPDQPVHRTPMRPINLPAYGKVEACPRSRRTSPSAA